ncbi:MAG: hypothetical protein ACI9NQ_001447 [Paracoccaceae bacterium]|jgi:hypothetical protein
MKLLLLLGYFLFGVSTQRMKVIEVEAVELRQAVPREVRPAEAKLEIEIEIDAEGKVRATSGDDKLEAFDGSKKGNWKPLGAWIAGLQRRNVVQVAIKVHGEAKQQLIIHLLTILSEQEVTAITFSDLHEK